MAPRTVIRSKDGATIQGNCLGLSFALLIFTLIAVSRAFFEFEPPTRDGISDGSRCPALPSTPALDGGGAAWNQTFTTKRSVGSWLGTVELGAGIADTFASSGWQFVIPCGWRVDALGRDFELHDAGGDLVASVAVDPLSWGWDFVVYDCVGEVISEVRQSSVTRLGQELEISDATGIAQAATDYTISVTSVNVITLTGSSGQGVIGSLSGGNSVKTIGTEWRCLTSGQKGADPRVLGAIAAFATWKDKGKHGDFTGICQTVVFTGELMVFVMVGFAVSACAGSMSDRPKHADDDDDDDDDDGGDEERGME